MYMKEHLSKYYSVLVDTPHAEDTESNDRVSFMKEN